ncbi:hypothetical protein [Mycolicibacterium sphagni]|uniref:hypothetical protein n=1 Tax=Mycolicibacterium sphagni TaxID=1786 RepID=UPI0021F2E335|nr:hypothetical protein [Mycolicibacterium sphagni]MCV7174766.1 hypothetical protein [Mycolicibacterium sphagni]
MSMHNSDGLENRLQCTVCRMQGRQTPATTVARGYAVCGQHTEMSGHPGFDPASDRENRGRETSGVERRSA